MYIKVTKSRNRQYVQLAESYRDEEGRSRQRILANLGRLDEEGGQVDTLIDALLRARERARGE